MIDAGAGAEGITSATNAKSELAYDHGAYRDRTGDPQLAKLVLSQLS
jgi:hypothetical protein